MERAQRRVLIQYPKRQTAARHVQADRSHLPLKINTAGVIPPIFASSLLLMPLTITQFAGSALAGESKLGRFHHHAQPVSAARHRRSTCCSTAPASSSSRFFYTAVVFNPEETADNLKRYGGFIPGIRPGKNTEDYFDYVLTRITVIGAAYLTIICLVPEYLVIGAGIPFYLGGTSLLIVVNVTMDTVTQIQCHLLAHQYGDLIKKAKLKGASALSGADVRTGRACREHHPAGTAGRGQGHPGAAAGRRARHGPAVDRRHAARGGQGRHAGRPARPRR